MAVALSYPSKPIVASVVPQERFIALEKRVESLVLQMQLLGANPTSSPEPYDLRLSGPNCPPLASHPALPNISRFNFPTPPTAQPEGNTSIHRKPSTKLALQILDILQRYGEYLSTENVPWAGKANFIPSVEECIQNKEPIRMVLPAFPFKSPNRNEKVLGSMPDLGEELALIHLNGLCESIAEVYDHGANATITSDGLVYNDLMGIEDSEVWEYSTAVRNIINEEELRHVSTLRIVDLLDIPIGTEKLMKEEYLLHAGCWRRELVARFGPLNFDSREAVRNDKDLCMTYRGYIKFLTKDLRYSHLGVEFGGEKRKYKDAIEKLALQMIYRGRAFASAIENKCKGYVRLSIHPSSGQTKLSIPLIPQPKGRYPMTPWHSSIAVGIDGSFRTVHAEEVKNTHDLILRDGQPYYFREQSDLYEFGETKIQLEHLYPCGLIIRPASELTTQPSFRDIDMQKIRRLAELQSPVVLRGFADTTNRELFIRKARECGEILPWTFGIIQEVKDHGSKDKQTNNVVSNEAMPMHYDGIFKFETQKDENGNVMLDEEGKEIKVQKPPRFQLFTSIAVAPKGTGSTLFASSRLFFQHLPPPYTLPRLQSITWATRNDGYWSTNLTNQPLVVPHPVTQNPCIRWHEPWDASKTKFSTFKLEIEGGEADVVEGGKQEGITEGWKAGVVDMVNRGLYDRRVCLRWEWERGDVLLSDNVAMMHTRTAFVGDCERELWRIHLD